MKRAKRKTSPLELIGILIVFFFVFTFFYGVASAYISGQPTKKFNDKIISECEREFHLAFDGSFTPVQFRHYGMRDSVYTLWIKDISSPEAFMEKHYGGMYELEEYEYRPASIPEELAEYACDKYCVIELNEKTDNTVKISFSKNSEGNYAAVLERVYF